MLISNGISSNHVLHEISPTFLLEDRLMLDGHF